MLTHAEMAMGTVFSLALVPGDLPPAVVRSALGAACATLHQAEQATRLLGVPAGMTVAMALSFGYPHPRGRGSVERAVMRVLTGRGRRPLAEMLSWEQYGAPAPPGITRRQKES